MIMKGNWELLCRDQGLGSRAWGVCLACGGWEQLRIWISMLSLYRAQSEPPGLMPSFRAAPRLVGHRQLPFVP